MKKPRVRRVGKADDGRRKPRPRPVPKWLMKAEALDAVARSRCLLVLSVLSGALPVTEAIAEAKIARGTYYQLETRALKAMLAALNPLAASGADGAPDLSQASCRIEALEAQVKKLVQEKRRAERLLMLTRKTLRTPVLAERRGRMPTAPPSILRPLRRLPSSKAKKEAPPATLMPMPDGVVGC